MFSTISLPKISFQQKKGMLQNFHFATRPLSFDHASFGDQLFSLKRSIFVLIFRLVERRQQIAVTS